MTDTDTALDTTLQFLGGTTVSSTNTAWASTNGVVTSQLAVGDTVIVGADPQFNASTETTASTINNLSYFAKGKVLINDSNNLLNAPATSGGVTKTYYGLDTTNAYVNGATSLTISGGSVTRQTIGSYSTGNFAANTGGIVDVQTDKLAANSSDARGTAGTSKLASVTLKGVSGTVGIASDVLNTLNISDSQAKGGLYGQSDVTAVVVTETPAHTLNLVLSNDAIGTQVTDATATAVVVSTAAATLDGAAASAILIIAAALKSLTVTGTADLMLSGAGTLLTSVNTTAESGVVAIANQTSASGATFKTGAGATTINGGAGLGNTDTITGGSGTVYFTEHGMGAISATLGNGGTSTTPQVISWDTIVNSSAITVTAGNGLNRILIPNSTGIENVTLGNGGTSGHTNVIILGNGHDTVSVGTGYNTVYLGTGVDAVSFGTHSSATSSHDNVNIPLAGAGAVNTATNTTASITFGSAGVSTLTGLVKGDVIDFSVFMQVTESTAKLTASNLQGVATDIELAAGTYTKTTGKFTYASAGVDSLLTYDTGNTNLSGTEIYNSIVLVGYHISATASVGGTSGGVLSL